MENPLWLSGEEMRKLMKNKKIPGSLPSTGYLFTKRKKKLLQH
jgi:hypothetical protein